jgi:pimeloyl-ACP methyl ester carboxylesterase
LPNKVVYELFLGDVGREWRIIQRITALATIQGAGHAVFIDEPEKFDDAFVQLLKRVAQ